MKKMMIGTLAVAGAALIAATAYADDGKGRGHGGHWDKMDANGDGVLTADEVSGRSAEWFAAADADGDGAVTKEEMKAYHQAKRAERREKHNPDKNGDGVVDRTEYITAAQDRFDRLDKNGDGVLSEDELRRNRGHHRRGGKKED